MYGFVFYQFSYLPSKRHARRENMDVMNTTKLTQQNRSAELHYVHTTLSGIFIERMFTRRTFLKLAAQLSIVMAGSHVQKAFASTERQRIIEQAGYGTGDYGSGDYPGYTIYLPQISKEEQ